MNLQEQKVYLPTTSQKWLDVKGLDPKFIPVFGQKDFDWIKEESKILLTKEELKEIIRNAFDKGVDSEDGSLSSDQYLIQQGIV